MTRNLKRRIISSITSLAMVFSFGATNALDAYNSDTSELQSGKLNYDSIEELPDGGKIYTYNIGGVINQFPVPPKGFNPITATDEQLETYAFPARPDKNNNEDYQSWLSLMESYKFTSAPEISVVNNSISNFNSDIGDVSTYAKSTDYGLAASGYYSHLGESKEFYTQLQVDYVHPKVTAIGGGNSGNSYWVGFGHYSGARIQAGTANKNYDQPWAWYSYNNRVNLNSEIKIDNFIVNAGDNIHIYIAFMKSSGKLNYYFVNMTTGKSVSSVVSIPNAEMYFNGQIASWSASPLLSKGYPTGTLGNYGRVTFKNCKAMLNTSNTWIDFNQLSNINKMIMVGPNGTQMSKPSLYKTDSFQCMWLSYI